jgi:hypothetical protein
MKLTTSSDSTTTPTNRYPLRSRVTNTTIDNNCNNSIYPTRNSTRTNTINTNNTHNTTITKKATATNINDNTYTKRRINLQSQTTLTPTKLSPDEITRRNLVVRPIVDSLFTKKISNINHRLNRDDYIKILEEYNPHFPWLTKDTLKQRIKCKYHRYKKKNKQEESNIIEPTTDTTPNTTPTDTPTCKKGGRPIGTTDDMKRHTSLCISAAKLEICDLYKIQMQKRSEMGNIQTK